jgi:hypothetical protein
MLKASAAISAQAITATIAQNKNSLDPAVVTQLGELGKLLRKNPTLTEQTIEQCVAVIYNYPTLTAAYNENCNQIQAPANNRDKGPSPSTAEGVSEDNGSEIANSFRETLLALEPQNQEPLSFWQRLFGGKSQAS